MEILAYPIVEVAGKKEPTQEERLMEIDQWLQVLFQQMDSERKEMHRLPKRHWDSTHPS